MKLTPRLASNCRINPPAVLWLILALTMLFTGLFATGANLPARHCC